MQFDLPGLSLPARRPLLPVAAVGTLLDLDPLEVLAACENGELEWAFDLAVRGATRREIRIWRGSVVDALRKVRISRTEDEVLSDILPPHHPRSSELKRRLQVSRDLIADLLQEHALDIHQQATRAVGVNAACRLDRSSVVKFLQARRMA